MNQSNTSSNSKIRAKLTTTTNIRPRLKPILQPSSKLKPQPQPQPQPELKPRLKPQHQPQPQHQHQPQQHQHQPKPLKQLNLTCSPSIHSSSSSSSSSNLSTTSTVAYQQQQLTPKFTRLSSSTPTQSTHHDQARVNRKILDLEISNASLLAINGALERTKVKQQNEIRSLKRTLSNHSTITNDHQQQQQQPQEQEEQEDSLETLIAQDPSFAQLIHSIDHLIHNASQAINHQYHPPLTPTHQPITTNNNNNLIDPPTLRPSLATRNTKVLNPIEIEQRRLDQSSLDST